MSSAEREPLIDLRPSGGYLRRSSRRPPLAAALARAAAVTAALVDAIVVARTAEMARTHLEEYEHGTTLRPALPLHRPGPP